MVVRDGEGTWIDFQWPSMWYVFKATVVITVAWWLGTVFVAIPAFFLTGGALAALVAGLLHIR
jgi:hypothetical protein